MNIPFRMGLTSTVRLTMRPQSNDSAKDAISPNLSSSSQFSEARTSASTATTPTWPDSPFPGSGHSDCEDHNLLDSDLVDASSSWISTRLTHSPLQPQAPKRLPARPNSGARVLALDLPRLSESSESLPSRPRLQNNVDQITNCPASLSIVGATTSGSAASSSASLESSLTDSEYSDSEDVSSSSSGPHVKRRRFPFLFNILASESSRRAQARKNRIRRLIELLKEIRDGKYRGTRLVIERTLNPSEYRELCARIEVDEKLNGFFDEKLRFKYSNARRKFTIYMPTGFHTVFGRQSEQGILGQLRAITSDKHNDIIARIAKNVDVTGEAKIRSLDPNIEEEKISDGSFKLRGYDYPGLLIEVAWSHENMLELEQKAKDYFRLSQGKVRSVVCFDFSEMYKNQQTAQKKWLAEEKKKRGSSSASRPLTFLEPTAAATRATFSVFRAREAVIGKDSVRDQTFPRETQQPAEDISLKLSLEDFVCKEAVRRLCSDLDNLQTIEYPQLEIPSKMLCDWFEAAVENYRPEWSLDMQIKAQNRQKKKSAKAAKLEKEAAALEKKTKTSLSDQLRNVLKGRILRSAVQKEIKNTRRIQNSSVTRD